MLIINFFKNKKVDLKKLAFHYSATNPSIDTTIVSVTSEDFIEQNVSFLSDLTKEEEMVMNEVLIK
jgi:aryl-alcohol dehydrogenase-like predicted oxidoreductase